MNTPLIFLIALTIYLFGYLHGHYGGHKLGWDESKKRFGRERDNSGKFMPRGKN